jgi:RNA polymerase sigma factor (sigma-70 family)
MREADLGGETSLATEPINRLIQHLVSSFSHDGAGKTDGELLDSFILHKDEAAIAALVRRHGPMVWGVCCRMLRNDHDAEDAFQAAFLVLVQKAATLPNRETVGNWLYGVAHQTALRMRALAAKRNVRERQLVVMPEIASPEKSAWDDLQPALDQELARLPDKYRALIVLCDLEEKTRKDVARQLSIPEGTVASRLATAREMLAKRMSRHGITVSSVLLGSILSPHASSANVPVEAISSTIKAATLVAAGQGVAGAASATVATLTIGVTKAMLMSKIKTVMVIILIVGLTFSGAGLGLRLFGGPPAAEQANVDGWNTPVVFPIPQRDKEAPPKHYTNTLGMKFVWIPPGSFIMGSPKNEEGREPGKGTDETQHKVTLTKGFYMSVYPVTQEQWESVMGNNPSAFKGEKNLPVDRVSWDDCQEFVKKLRENDKDKKAYRLPTEAEWEYGCRAGTTTAFFFGDTISTDQVNYNGEEVYGKGKKGINRDKPTPVGSFPANAWGLHDMHGNVYQWCQDFYGEYPKNDLVDPQGPAKAEGPGDGRVFRGGAWPYAPVACRSAARCVPRGGGFTTACIGFRLCFSAK